MASPILVSSVCLDMGFILVVSLEPAKFADSCWRPKDEMRSECCIATTKCVAHDQPCNESRLYDADISHVSYL